MPDEQACENGVHPAMLAARPPRPHADLPALRPPAPGLRSPAPWSARGRVDPRAGGGGPPARGRLGLRSGGGEHDVPPVHLGRFGGDPVRRGDVPEDGHRPLRHVPPYRSPLAVSAQRS
ncbi:hypothetical protein GCM10017667_75770 [Streptomyces filamentosus]|uniref:Uncharacterized protein n=1 Tax=Streptomyces filamentosus TaxID=67294 RepID=A0A919BXX8_STRFL|nr:hypothetical protein GCM10017667_75770 [Streptomyces filamentosus]